MFGDVLQRFVQKSPATVMVRGLLERLLNPEALDRWFEATAQAQYTRDILFSSLVGLMLQIVCRTQASVHAAYRHAQIAASIVSVYAKLRGVELTTSQGLVRHIAHEAQTVIETMNGGRPAPLPGYRLKYLDGNCLAASEHRLKALRTTAAGPLPGKSLVVFDPQMGLAVDVFPCADGHAQFRELDELALEGRRQVVARLGAVPVRGPVVGPVRQVRHDRVGVRPESDGPGGAPDLVPPPTHHTTRQNQHPIHPTNTRRKERQLTHKHACAQNTTQ